MAKQPILNDSDAEATKTPAEEPKSPKVLGWYEAIQAGDDVALDKAVVEEVTKIIKTHQLENYETLFLFDEKDSISYYHSDRLYAAASNEKNEKKDILLILHSNGGSIEPAYLISKALKRLSKNKFVVAVPRRAKSAATLISLGADEIHMGLNSQLGPIDPQVGGLPALAVGNALDVIADLVSRFPASANMLTNYLTAQIPIQSLGYYQRISESAVQYAERLFAGRQLGDKREPKEVAKCLVNEYKDHGFVIDIDEAINLLGNKIIQSNSAEYKAADEIYKFLDVVDLFLRPKDKYFWYVGAVQDGILIRPRRK